MNVYLHVWKFHPRSKINLILTLSGPTSGEFSQIQSKIHASDKYILRFISVRSMSGPEGVKAK